MFIIQVSQDRVKKVLSEMVILVDGKPKKVCSQIRLFPHLVLTLHQGLVNKSDPTLSSKELAKQKTEAALAKKK